MHIYLRLYMYMQQHRGIAVFQGKGSWWGARMNERQKGEVQSNVVVNKRLQNYTLQVAISDDLFT